MSGVDAKICATVAMPPPEDPQAETIGARLRRLRLDRAFSQRDLSSPGVSYAYISRIEAGARTPSVKALRMLAAKLGVSVEYLETGRDVRESEERELQLIDAELALRLDNDVARAEQSLHSVLQDARRAGDPVAETRAAVGLGFAAARRGNHLDAVEQLEAALKVQRLAPHVRPDVYATLGQSYAALGAPDRAARLFRECLDEAKDAAPDDHSIHVRFAALLSYALTDAGDYDGAAAAVREGLDHADATADPHNRIRLYWSIARAAGIDGRFSEALHYIRKAICLLEATDDTTQLARGYLMSAGIEAREGHVREAGEHLALAERLLGQAPEARDVAMIRIGRSRIARLERDADTAVESARGALDVLGNFHGGEQGAAIWALASGLALQRDDAGAVDAYRRAVDLLVVHGRRHEAAEAAVEWGTFLRECGREAEAESVLQRAADLGATAVEPTRRS
jgi:transcriptional regulator with XRE-family HTH domain